MLLIIQIAAGILLFFGLAWLFCQSWNGFVTTWHALDDMALSNSVGERLTGFFCKAAIVVGGVFAAAMIAIIVI